MDANIQSHFVNLRSEDADSRYASYRHLMAVTDAPVDKALQAAVVDRLSQRFRECSTEKNGTLVRYDILEVFRKTYDVVKEDALKQLALSLIETEEDPKYRKKYAGLWKDLVAKKRAAKA
ncbi:hypothetical protein D7Y13_31905 [Corallococcus praedator]|uniref:EF-hand domain-containing protein n=1 Tax=Corallococcus praedator TaxID=2316724 RepID=A0ABX9Q9U8_9BACT|nr:MULTISPECIES: hypothetical protein [Corallococcus]RKH05652.1 hypothetical protein D7X74_34380 [Corallococcus sp. CA047B]RKH22383.1 hypothetical protein D7X75_35590 [Corallococcus sp. CA031C]RKH95536.1 hypothetical protein D7Y13_31905 [Corallococcus praedator]